MIGPDNKPAVHQRFQQIVRRSSVHIRLLSNGRNRGRFPQFQGSDIQGGFLHREPEFLQLFDHVQSVWRKTVRINNSTYLQIRKVQYSVGQGRQNVDVAIEYVRMRA